MFRGRGLHSSGAVKGQRAAGVRNLMKQQACILYNAEIYLNWYFEMRYGLIITNQETIIDPIHQLFGSMIPWWCPVFRWELLSKVKSDFIPTKDETWASDNKICWKQTESLILAVCSQTLACLLVGPRLHWPCWEEVVMWGVADPGWATGRTPVEGCVQPWLPHSTYRRHKSQISCIIKRHQINWTAMKWHRNLLMGFNSGEK